MGFYKNCIMNKSFKKTMFIVLLGVINFSTAQAFDCTKAKTKTEKSVCASKELLKLDETLNKTYSEKLARLNVQTDLKNYKSAQRSWIKSNEDTCQGAESCLIQRYNERIKLLSEYKTQAAVEEKIEGSKEVSYKVISIDDQKHYDKKIEYPEFSGSSTSAVSYLNEWVKSEIKEGTQCESPGADPEQVKNYQMYYTIKVLKVTSSVAALSESSSTMCGSPNIVDSESSVLLDLKNQKKYDHWKELSQSGRQ